MFLKNLSNPQANPVPLTQFLCFGSADDNHIKIDELAVAERHARLEKKDNSFILRDLRSSCGTYVNGIRVLETFVEIGDVIRIGEQEFILDKEEEQKIDFTSHNIEWNKTLQKIPQYAKTDLPILILGPSGCGKELLAQQIHDRSSRKRRPIIRVNCSALSESLAESELFGHLKGSFTGATQDRKGAFEAARTGTLVLDEVGDLPLCLQPKLLRALENKEIKPVGSDKVIKTNVRIVASTHQDLKTKVIKGEFRQDLFFRLNVLQIQAPSLTDRMEDFEKLLFEFAREMKVKFSYLAIQELKKHSWPGNIRELKNTVSRALVLKNKSTIEPEDIQKILDKPVNKDLAMSLGEVSLPVTPRVNLIKEIEKQMILKRLIANKGSQRKTSEDLGIPKSTLNDRIKAYEIDIEELMQMNTEALEKNIS